MGLSPSADNYVLGKGVVYFDRYDFTNSKYTGERDLGNAPDFTFNIAIDKLEHFSSRGGLKAKDKTVITQMTPGISFTLDEINSDNLALLTMAEIEEITQTSATGVQEDTHIAHLDKYIILDKRGISNVVVKDVTDTTTYVENTDYVINASLKDDVIGRIFIPKSGGTIAEDDVLHITYDAAGVTYTKIKAFKESQTEGRLRFVSDNPVGTNQELEAWRVSLIPDGDTAMIGDDWSTLGFTGEVLKDETNHSDSPYFDIIIA